MSTRDMVHYLARFQPSGATPDERIRILSEYAKTLKNPNAKRKLLLILAEATQFNISLKEFAGDTKFAAVKDILTGKDEGLQEFARMAKKTQLEELGVALNAAVDTAVATKKKMEIISGTIRARALTAAQQDAILGLEHASPKQRLLQKYRKNIAAMFSVPTNAFTILTKQRTKLEEALELSKNIDGDSTLAKPLQVSLPVNLSLSQVGELLKERFIHIENDPLTRTIPWLLANKKTGKEACCCVRMEVEDYGDGYYAALRENIESFLQRPEFVSAVYKRQEHRPIEEYGISDMWYVVRKVGGNFYGAVPVKRNRPAENLPETEERKFLAVAGDAEPYTHFTNIEECLDFLLPKDDPAAPPLLKAGRTDAWQRSYLWHLDKVRFKCGFFCFCANATMRDEEFQLLYFEDTRMPPVEFSAFSGPALEAVEDHIAGTSITKIASNVGTGGLPAYSFGAQIGFSAANMVACKRIVGFPDVLNPENAGDDVMNAWPPVACNATILSPLEDPTKLWELQTENGCNSAFPGTYDDDYKTYRLHVIASRSIEELPNRAQAPGRPAPFAALTVLGPGPPGWPPTGFQIPVAPVPAVRIPAGTVPAPVPPVPGPVALGWLQRVPPVPASVPPVPGPVAPVAAAVPASVAPVPAPVAPVAAAVPPVAAAVPPVAAAVAPVAAAVPPVAATRAARALAIRAAQAAKAARARAARAARGAARAARGAPFMPNTSGRWSLQRL
jgi:hypothetical protein